MATTVFSATGRGQVTKCRRCRACLEKVEGVFLDSQKSKAVCTPSHDKTSPIFSVDRSRGSSDETHFWLNGYVNKQNCRIWSEANPQVYVETPLRPEKLTVWCALWAGGILLQKR
ncbi:hypothetical protein TNCV_4968371 [Trichonephila clavipes]|nr:hypothetical protein TNCV_4968371 [Trichonephila clavipes]